MGKEGNYSAGAKVYESKKEKKRRLLMNSVLESEEFVITPSGESGRPSRVPGKWDGGEKRVTRSEVLRSKLGSEESKGKVMEAREDSKSRGTGVDQPDCVDKNLESADSAENQTDTIGVSTVDSMASLNLRHDITGIAKENDSESKSERKRSMETYDNEFKRKKAKADHLDSGDDQAEKSEGDKNLAIGEHTYKDMGSVNGDVQDSKLPVSWANERDGEGSSERNLHPSPGASGKSGIKMQGKNVAGVLPSKKEVTVIGDAIIPCEEQGSTRRLRSSSMNKSSTLNNQLEKQVGKKSNSSIKHRKRAGKISSDDTSKSSFSKKKLKSVSPKEGSMGTELLHSKSFLAEKNGEKFKESNRSRSAAKNEIRDQIKNILLDAGWKVEYRPRKERDYLDSVYVSPQGSGYWSITKAYDIYVRQFQSASNVKEGSEKQSKASTGRDSNCEKAISTLVVIPPEVLLMLKRKVVNKRRRKEEIEEVRRKKETKDVKHKAGVGRRKKKGEEVTKVKRFKDKGTRDEAGGTRSMKRKLAVKNSKKRGRALLVRGSNQDDGSENGDYTPYAWKRTVLSWLIDLGLLQAYGKVTYMNKRRTRALLDGRITRDGIQCSCCSKILTVSKFEIHAGSKLRQPYENICLEVSGISLLQCQINAWEKESKLCIFYDVDTDGDDPNDDTCAICGDGGDLICCDSCPSTFHLGCLGIEMLPTGDWHCTNCSCKFCRSVHDSTSQDGDALFTCSQCSQKYHKNCVPEGDAVSNFHNSSSNIFCGRSCRKVFRKLQQLIGVRNKLETGIFWSIVRRFDDSKFHSGMAKRVECNSKTAVAYAVMDECFVPIIDQRSSINLIHNVVYNCGANFNRLNFSGFYTFILERADEIIAAASVRIHDTSMAEMPFIGTRSMYRRQGMCRLLLKGIESALRSLCIDKLIIPAISELTEIWTSVFGFKPLEISQMQEVKSVNMLVFPGTGLLQKSLKRVSNKQHTNPELENKPGTQVSVEAPQNCSADELIDRKESKCVAETMQPDISLSEHTNNLLPDASRCCAQICISLDSAANADSNEIQNVSFCSNNVDKDISPINCSNEIVAFIEEIKEGEDVKNGFLSFQQPSEFLHGASEIKVSVSRPPQNKSNFELPDVSKSFNYEKEDESTVGFLQKLKDKLPSNGVAPDVSLEKCVLMEEARDRAHDINVVKLMHDYNGLESNVNEESVEVSVDVSRHLSTSTGKGTYASSEVCENSCGANTKVFSVTSDESSQEKSELLQNQLKCYIGANDSAPLDQLAVIVSAKSLDIESVSGIV